MVLGTQGLRDTGTEDRERIGREEAQEAQKLRLGETTQPLTTDNGTKAEKRTEPPTPRFRSREDRGADDRGQMTEDGKSGGSPVK